MMAVDYRKVGLFLGTSFLFSWILTAAFIAFGGKWNTPASVPVGVAYMFGPFLAAVLVQKVFYGEPWRRPLGVSFRLNRWFLVAWFLPPAAAVASFGIGLLLPGVEYSPDMAGMFQRFESTIPAEQLEQMRSQFADMPLHPFWIGLLQSLVAGITISAVAGFGEEIGWRGFLQKELAVLRFWRSSLVVGFIWGIWHAPIILLGHNYPQHPRIGVVFMLLFCLLCSPIFSYIRLKAGSVVAAAVLHGSLNAGWGLSVMLLVGGSDLTIGMTGLAGLIVLTLINLGLILFGRTSSFEAISGNE